MINEEMERMIRDIVIQTLDSTETKKTADSESKKLLIVNCRNLDLVEEFKNTWEVTFLNTLQSNVYDYQGIFLDRVNQDTFVQIALGLANKTETEIVSKYLLMNKKVFLRLEKSLNRYIQSSENNNAYINKLQDYYRMIQDFGVEFIDTDMLKSYRQFNEVKKIIKPLLRVQDLEYSNCNTIKIQRNTIITPLALDLIKERQIKILRGERKDLKDE